MKSINPATQEVIKEYTPHSQEKINEIIKQTHESYLTWKETPYDTKQKLMMNLASILRNEVDKLAHIMTLEMGKPLNDSKSEIFKCALVTEYYANNTHNILKEERINTSNKKAKVIYQPIGVILGVMPWNFPFWQVFRYLIPNLMLGNTSVIKHASNVLGCGEAIQELFIKANFPKDTVRHIITPGKDVEKIIRNPFIKGVTLTGSGPAGSSVAKIAGECLKKSVLELGGSDPYIVCEDADLELAAKVIIKSRLINNGQTCISAKRFIVNEKIYNKFIPLLSNEMKKYRFGNPLTHLDFELGSMARIDLRNEVHEQVKKLEKEGAKILLGGYIPNQTDEEKIGAYYPPTLIDGVSEEMPTSKEEIFGPVGIIFKATNDDQAIKIANNSPFGLGAAVFTSSKEREDKFSIELEAGNIGINSFVVSDSAIPFGGIKESGYGRELSKFGLIEFSNIKSIVKDA